MRCEAIVIVLERIENYPKAMLNAGADADVHHKHNRQRGGAQYPKMGILLYPEMGNDKI
jgi:hypothetical protein